jgi:hypothetical protein
MGNIFSTLSGAIMLSSVGVYGECLREDGCKRISIPADMLGLSYQEVVSRTSRRALCDSDSDKSHSISNLLAKRCWLFLVTLWFINFYNGLFLYNQ